MVEPWEYCPNCRTPMNRVSVELATLSAAPWADGLTPTDEPIPHTVGEHRHYLCPKCNTYLGAYLGYPLPTFPAYAREEMERAERGREKPEE